MLLVRSGFVAELVFFDLAVEGGQSDIEEAGGFGLIALGMVEHPLDMELLYAGHVEGRERAIGPEAGDL